MVRTSTPLKIKHSPANGAKRHASNKSSLLRSVFKPSRSPVDDKQHNFPLKFKPIRHSPYKRPVLAPRNKLQTIREDSLEEEEAMDDRKIDMETSIPKDFIMDELSDVDGNDSSGDSDYEGWDDETTLVAKFQENAPESSSREKAAELAYQLEVPMQARADQLKQHLAHTLAPATRKVKDVHNALEQKVDVALGVGILSFDDSCKQMEQLSLHDEENIKEAVVESQRKVTEYFKQIEEAYQKRNQLWDHLRDAVEKSSAKTLAALGTLPSEIDDVSAAIEKKVKEVTKAGGKDNKAKLLRDLLAEM